MERGLIAGGTSAALSAVPVVGGALQMLTPIVAPVVTDVIDALGSVGSDVLGGVGDFVGGLFGSTPSYLSPTGRAAAANVAAAIKAGGLNAADRRAF